MYGTTSQQDGGFLIDNLEEGRYILWAYDPEDTGLKPSIYGYQEDLADDQTSSEGYNVYYNYMPRPNYIPVRVSAGETAGSFTLSMDMGGSLSGRITDEGDGSAIADATIMAVPLDPKGYLTYLVCNKVYITLTVTTVWGVIRQWHRVFPRDRGVPLPRQRRRLRSYPIPCRRLWPDAPMSTRSRPLIRERTPPLPIL